MCKDLYVPAFEKNVKREGLTKRMAVNTQQSHPLNTPQICHLIAVWTLSSVLPWCFRSLSITWEGGDAVTTKVMEVIYVNLLVSVWQVLNKHVVSLRFFDSPWMLTSFHSSIPDPLKNIYWVPTLWLEWFWVLRTHQQTDRRKSNAIFEELILQLWVYISIF